MNPFQTAVDFQRQQIDAAGAFFRKSQIAPSQFAKMADVEVGQTPHEVVYEENKLQLYHYESPVESTYDVPILIVYALINRPYILDLQPDRSVVRRLLEAGFDVYLINWGEPSNLDVHLTLDDYVTRYIDNCVEVVRERSGQESINFLGYCMGGSMSAMYAALYPEKVRNLGLMAAGLCFGGTAGILELWGGERYYSPATVRDTFGNVPADFLDAGFALMDPVSNYVTKYVRLYDNLDDDDFVENFARMERWLSEGIDIAGDTYVQFLEDLYQDNKLAKNELYIDGKHVDLSEITMPILQIVGEYDHLMPSGASKPFNELVPSEDTETIEFPTGHIGLSVSSRSHSELWPQVAEWYAERSVGEGPEPEERAEAEPATPTESDRSSAEEAEAEREESERAEPAGDEESAIAEENAGAERAERAEADRPPREELEAETELHLESVEGIGPAYAERLRGEGVEDVLELARVDIEELADRVSISITRLERWAEQARERTRRR